MPMVEVSNGGIPFQTATYTSTSARYSKPVATTSETFTATDDCIYCIRLSCSLAANTFTLSTTGQTLTISGNNTNNARIAVLLAAGQSVTYQFHINQSGGGTLEYWKII